MAALSASERSGVWADIMRLSRAQFGGISVTKAELKAAMDAIDDWLEANASSLNAAIPQPARGALVPEQKAYMLSVVARRRAERN